MQGGGESPQPCCFGSQEIFAQPCFDASCHVRGYDLSAVHAHRSVLMHTARFERAPEILHGFT
jgi:hypothetical protein